MKRKGYINNVEIFLLLLLECFDASRTDYLSSYYWLKMMLTAHGKSVTLKHGL